LKLEDELVSNGAEIKNNLAGTRYVEKDASVIAKECTRCNEIKFITDFPKQKGCFGDVRSNCKTCEVKRRQKSYEDNREKTLIRNQFYYENNRNEILKQKSSYYESHRDKKLEINREWYKSNPEKARLIKQRRRSRESSLPDTLTQEELDVILKRFDGGCALTGSHDIQLDHAIPLATGHGGTIFQNIIPMRSDLNNSKKHANIFEWFERNRERFSLPQEKFDSLIDWLSEINNMTVNEYRNYVYQCHKKKEAI
jgi:hypothetical protein